MPVAFSHLPVKDMPGVTQNFEQLSQIIWPPVVSALPSNPADGQLVCFQTAAMAEQGVVWTLRYRAASTSTHKWEAVDAPAMCSSVAEDNLTVTNAGTTASVPAITTPLAGEYDVEVRAGVHAGKAATVYYLYATSMQESGGLFQQTSSAGYGNVTNKERLTYSAATAVHVGANSNESSSSAFDLYNAVLTVRPVRLG